MSHEAVRGSEARPVAAHLAEHCAQRFERLVGDVVVVQLLQILRRAAGDERQQRRLAARLVEVEEEEEAAALLRVARRAPEEVGLVRPEHLGEEERHLVQQPKPEARDRRQVGGRQRRLEPDAALVGRALEHAERHGDDDGLRLVHLQREGRGESGGRGEQPPLFVLETRPKCTSSIVTTRMSSPALPAEPSSRLSIATTGEW